MFLVFSICRQFASQGVETDAQGFGGLGFVVVELAVDVEDMGFFDLFQGRDGLGGRWRALGLFGAHGHAADVFGQVLDFYAFALGQIDR